MPTLPSAPAPGGVASASAASGGSGHAQYGILVLLLVMAAPTLLRASRAASALWRPVPFLCLIEQPG
jgi:hypothetical protein